MPARPSLSFDFLLSLARAHLTSFQSVLSLSLLRSFQSVLSLSLRGGNGLLRRLPRASEQTLLCRYCRHLHCPRHPLHLWQPRHRPPLPSSHSNRSPPNSDGSRPQSPFPRTSCDALRREYLSPESRTERTHSSPGWREQSNRFSAFFRDLAARDHVHNSSRALCVAAGGGVEVAALSEAVGLADVTGVEIFDSPPLVSRADPHNLPFSDSIFDFSYSSGMELALFPLRFASEMERTVRAGGIIVITLAGFGRSPETSQEIKRLFRDSDAVSVGKANSIGEGTVEIVFRKKNP